MTEERVVVKSSVGLHARPASAFVREALKHNCKIQVEAMGRKVDGKSILQILSLGVKRNQEITIRADGAGEVEAVSALVNLVRTTA